MQPYYRSAPNPYGHFTDEGGQVIRERRKLLWNITVGNGRRWIFAMLLSLLMPSHAKGQEAILDVLPIRPFNFDVAVRQQTFGPDDREIGIQAGITALRYGNLEVRSIYQFFSIHTKEFQTDQHSVFLNPRWNNFIDVLDFPKGMPINRLIRHALFGPLEDRAVPYVGLLGGAVMPGPGHSAPGHLFGGQLGVRFPVARGLSVDMGLQYSQYGIDFRGEGGQVQQWIFLTGVRF
ncbi:MAG: hypothetical protein HY581_09925 [Nitrospirae bacterium]|nr:hypothetical protein [Nitrospirota bacterium]